MLRLNIEYVPLKDRHKSTLDVPGKMSVRPNPAGVSLTLLNRGPHLLIPAP